MPRLSLYRPNRTNDYQFLDRTISEMYTVGGLDIYVHKYLGPKTGDAGDADAGRLCDAVGGERLQPRLIENPQRRFQDEFDLLARAGLARLASRK